MYLPASDSTLKSLSRQEKSDVKPLSNLSLIDCSIGNSDTFSLQSSADRICNVLTLKFDSDEGSDTPSLLISVPHPAIKTLSPLEINQKIFTF